MAALNNDSVVNKQDERLVGNLKFEMAKMNDTSDKLSKELDNFEETDEVIMPKVINLLNTKLKLQIPIEPQEIDRLHRVGKPKQSSPRAVLIKFAR